VSVGRPPSFQWVGSARRSGPKLQARSAVSRADDDLFELAVLFYRAALARGESRTTRRSSLQQIFRWALPRRAREGGTAVPAVCDCGAETSPTQNPKIPCRACVSLAIEKPTGLRPQIWDGTHRSIGAGAWFAGEVHTPPHEDITRRGGGLVLRGGVGFCRWWRGVRGLRGFCRWRGGRRRGWCARARGRWTRG